MEVLYCTRLIPHIHNLYEKYPNHRFIISVDKFIMNQINGIESVTKKNVSIINIPEVPIYPKFPSLILHKAYWSHAQDCIDIDIGFINLPVFRQMIVPNVVSKYLRTWIKDNKKEQKVILTYSTNPMSMSAVIKAKRKDNSIKTVLVVGDLIGDKGIDIRKKGLLNKLLNIYYQKGCDYIPEFDGFILITDYMASELNVENKPTLVIEGIYNKDIEIGKKETADDQDDLKIIFHAGSLERRFGVFNLIDAFSMLKGENYRLWLAGGSTEAEAIRNSCDKDPRIKYFGFVSPQQVMDLQGQATVIVNPRTTEGEFTKYSFPSKTMEGLASGKPFIGCKLPGIPDEYFDYIQCVDDDTAESLCKKIKEVCELTMNERNEIGNKSREFILKNKNCYSQGKKIVDFLESL